jgi:DNA-binding response OmpR family regulator
VASPTLTAIEQDHQAASPPSPGARPIGILVVDDEEALLRMLGVGMRAHGFAVWLASNSTAAVELYLGNHNAIDIVLLDVRMPAQDGPETLAALRVHNPHVHFCFMTGETGSYIDENLLALGAVAVFKKPFRIRELARELKRIDASLVSTDAVQETR